MPAKPITPSTEREGDGFKSGDRVMVTAGHPHSGRFGVLQVYKKYGPAVFKWEGWLIRFDDGHEAYVKPSQIKTGNTEQRNA